jgi:hypothetical protein
MAITSDDDTELRALQEENARLREELSRLRPPPLLSTQ